MLNWKNRTVTPAGGVSVTVRLTGTSAGFEPPIGVVPTEDWLPHPDINRRNTAMMQHCAALCIFASERLRIKNRHFIRARSSNFLGGNSLAESHDIDIGCSGSAQGCSSSRLLTSLSLCPSPLVNCASSRQTKIQNSSMVIESVYDRAPARHRYLGSSRSPRLPLQVGFRRLFVVHAFHFETEQAIKLTLEACEIGHRAEIFGRDLRP